MLARLAVLALAVLAVSCGGSSGTSCNNAATFACATITVTGGTLSNATCSGTTVDSCAAGFVARCTSTGTVTQGSATLTVNTVLYYYTGATLDTYQAACTASGGTWSTP